jgi:hypothetical protein
MAMISSSNEEIRMLIENGLAMPFPFARKATGTREKLEKD